MKVKKGAGGVKAKPKPRKNAKKKGTSSKKTTALAASTIASNGAIQVVPPPKLKLTASSTPPTIPPVKPITSKEARQIISSDAKVLEIFRDLYLNGYGSNVVAWTVKKDDPIINDIRTYIRRGQEHYRIKIVSILRVISKAHRQTSFDDPPPLLDSETGASKSNRMMLWHGTKKRNIGPILQKGFRLPDLFDQIFGSGIYFSDRASNSCQYSYSKWDNSPYIYLLLCDVQLGNIYRAYEPIFDLREPPSPEKFDSVQGVGHRIPDGNENKTVDGSTWPLGKTVPNVNREDIDDYDLLDFNEYVVYKRNRVTPKYLVKVEISSKI